MSGMIEIAKFAVLEAWRTRFIAMLILAGVAALGLSLFSGQLAVTETAQTRAAITGAAVRLVWVVALAVFVIAGLVREQQDKGIEWYWAMPLSRRHYFLGKLLGFAAVAAIACAISFIALLWTVPISWLAQWSVALFLELLIVSGFGMLCALAFSQTPAAVVATLAFYGLGRVIDAVVLMVRAPLLPETQLSAWIQPLVDVIAAIMPDFSIFAHGGWLAYGPSGDALAMVAAHAALYLVLVGCAGLIDIHRKNL